MKTEILISIVDDDLLVREATVDLVNSLGYAAAAFDSAEAFLDSDAVGEASCLITDVQLPGISGVELQEQLQRRGYRIPVIFITAFPEARVRTRALAVGAVSFLTKPFEDIALVGSLDAALKD